MKCYEGTSQINGESIIGVITTPSNVKLGKMWQLWILHAEINPSEAVRTGADEAICGQCPHRGRSEAERTCYVDVWRAPQAIYRSLGDEWIPDDLKFDEGLRLGSYGEPVALPFDVVEKLSQRAKFSLGYTHRWKDCDPRFSQLLMASVENKQEAEEAQSMGWRTFRVKTTADPVLSNEIACPYETRNVTCKQCRLCRGFSTKAKNITINAHGFHYKVNRFNKRQGHPELKKAPIKKI